MKSRLPLGLGRLIVVLFVALIARSAATYGGMYEQAFGPFAVGDVFFGDGSELRANAGLGTTVAVAEPTQKELQLTADGVQNTRSAFILPVLDPGERVQAFSARWNSQVYAGTGNRADGFSLTFGQIPATPETYGAPESGFGVGLTLGIRTYINDGGRGFRVIRDGTELAYRYFDGWGDFNPERHVFELELTAYGTVNFWMDGTQYFTNVLTGFTPQLGDRFCFAARTGGQDEEVRLDNIAIYTGASLSETDWTAASGSGSSPAAEGPEKAFDRADTTKWLVLNTTSGYIQARAQDGIAKRVVAYTITSANNAPGRDPLTWRLQGSSNGTDWTSVDTEVYGEWSTRRYSRRAFGVDNPGDHLWYRLQVDSNHGDASLQLADLRLLVPADVSRSVRSTICDFDRLGLTQTRYAVAVGSGSFTPRVVAGSALGNVLRLTDGGAGEAVRVAFDQTCALTDPIYGPAPVVFIDLDLRAAPSSGQADGIGLILLRTADYGSSGVGGLPAFTEEPNITSAAGPNFGVGFDVYPNAGDPNNNHVSLHYGSTLTQNNVPFDFSTTRFHHAQVRIAFRVPLTGADVTVVMQENSLGMDAVVSGSPVTVIDNYYVAGLTPYDYRIAFSGRTGGQTATQELDNIYVLNGTAGFAHGGDMRGADATFGLVGNGQLRTDNGGAVYQEWLNLTGSANNQKGSGWKTVKQEVKHGFTTDFQWRVDRQVAGGADGLAFVVHNNGLSENPGEGGPGANALSVVFDTYTGSELYVKDGGTVLYSANLATLGFDFNSNPMNLQYEGRYNVHIDYAFGRLNVYLDNVRVVDALAVTLDGLANGPAVDTEGKAYVGFSGRTGGAAENHDVLNWHFASLVKVLPGTVFTFK